MTNAGVVVVDYGRGNLFSLGKALDHLGISHVVSDDADIIARAGHVVLPGVGAFGDAMNELHRRELASVLKDASARGVPLTGICLGMQLLAQSSEEFGLHEGLGLMPGKIVRLSQGVERIPNVGWRPLEITSGADGGLGVEDGAYVYFVHSYGLPDDDGGAAVTSRIRVNGEAFAASVSHGNVAGCQFHPEKSGVVGLRILDTLLRRVPLG